MLVVFEARARGRATQARLGSGNARAGTPVRLGRAAVPAWAFVVIVIGAAIVFPIGRVIQWVVTFESTEVDWSDVGRALAGTVRLSVLAALATVAVALPVGVLAARFRSRTSAAIESATYVAHALPGIVIAISLVFVGVRLLRPVYQETPLLVLGYVVLFLPLAVGSVRSSIEQSSVRVEEIARSLGMPPDGRAVAGDGAARAPGHRCGCRARHAVDDEGIAGHLDSAPDRDRHARDRAVAIHRGQRLCRCWTVRTRTRRVRRDPDGGAERRRVGPTRSAA